MSDRPLVALPEDEKIVLTVPRDAVARRERPLTVVDVQRLTWWPTRTGGGRELGRQRVSRALRSLADRGLTIRSRPDVYRYRPRVLELPSRVGSTLSALGAIGLALRRTLLANSPRTLCRRRDRLARIGHDQG